METHVDIQPLTKEKSWSEIPDCPVLRTLAIIGGKWKLAILWEIRRGTHRFGALQRALPECSKKMLTQQLRELEADGILWRRIYAEVPPRVEYGVTELGASLQPVLEQLAAWGATHGRERNG